MKYKIAIFLFILVLSLNVTAQSYDKSALDWIKSSVDKSGPITDLALTILALDINNQEFSTLKEALKERKNSLIDCYPETTCNSKDTALAIMALDSIGEPTTNLLSWINQTETLSSTRGDWLIQIRTSKEGNCSISNSDNEIKITIDSEGNIQPYNSKWADIVDDLNIPLDDPSEIVKVDCSDINDASLTISLIRRVDTGDSINLHSIQEEKKKVVNLIVNNACYASAPGQSCDKESTFYTTWALNNLNQPIHTISYLRDNADSTLEKAMLASISKEEIDIQELIDLKAINGSWDNDVFTTSFAIDALDGVSKYSKEKQNATQWILTSQKRTPPTKGSFGDVKSTSAAIYLVLTQLSTQGGSNTYCGDGFVDKPNDDGEYEQCDGSDDDNCPGSCNDLTCSCPEETTSCSTDSQCSLPEEYCDFGTGACVKRQTCATDGNCPTSQECREFLCYTEGGPLCGDGKKEESEECENSTHCLKDNEMCNASCSCEEKTGGSETEDNGNDGDDDGDGDEETGGFPFWIIWLIIILAILGLGGYLAYIKLAKKPPKDDQKFDFKKPERPKQPEPSRPQQPPGDNSLEKELDRSIKEAQDLLKK